MWKLSRVIRYHACLVTLLTVIIAIVATGCKETNSWSWITNQESGPKLSGYTEPALLDQKNNRIYSIYGCCKMSCCIDPDTEPKWTDYGCIEETGFFSSLAYDETRNILYAAYGSGVMRCDNTGNPITWVNMGGVDYNLAVCVDPIQNVLYTGTHSGVFKCSSPDTDPQWFNTGGGVEGSTVYGLICGQDAVYADNDNMGIGVWKYQGDTWSDISGEPAQPDYLYRTGSMVYDDKNDVLYLAAGKSGIMRCDHPATNPVWTENKPSEGTYNFSTITLDTNNNILYAGALEPEKHGLVSISTDTDMFADSKGVWICEEPLESLSLKKMGGLVSEDDIGWLSYDETRDILYGSSLSKGLWRYDAK